VLLAATLVLAGPEIRQEFLSTRNYQQDTSAQSRFESWTAGWQIAWDHPLLGTGVRNSNALTHNYGTGMQGRTIHNQYIQIAADSGIPAALVYLAILGVAGYRFSAARRACIRLESGAATDDQAAEWRNTASLCLALQSSLITFAINAMFLSIEVFELPWFLMVLGGVAPLALERRARFADASREAEEAEHDPTAPPIVAVVSGAPA
jgi:O-antigen ligase